MVSSPPVANDSGSRDREPARWISRMLDERGLLLLMTVFFGAVGLALWHLSDLATDFDRQAAIEEASYITRALKEFRTLYTSEVVERVRVNGVVVSHDYAAIEGAIPLPATLSMMLGRSISAADGDGEVRLYSAYPFPWRNNGGPQDEFERKALRKLRRHPDQPFYRFEVVDGQRLLRYATADLMRASCVECHNTHPDSPKTDWKEGDVRGVLAIARPLHDVGTLAGTKLRGTFVLPVPFPKRYYDFFRFAC